MPLIGLQETVKAIDNQVEEVNKSVKAIYMQGLGKIKMLTPVDKGTARGSWVMTVKQPSVAEIDKQHNDRINRMPAFVLDKKIFFTANSSYMHVLEYGGFKGVGEKTVRGNGGIFSDQKPSGWVRKEMIKIQNAIRKL